MIISTNMCNLVLMLIKVQIQLNKRHFHWGVIVLNKRVGYWSWQRSVLLVYYDLGTNHELAERAVESETSCQNFEAFLFLVFYFVEAIMVLLSNCKRHLLFCFSMMDKQVTSISICQTNLKEGKKILT